MNGVRRGHHSTYRTYVVTALFKTWISTASSLNPGRLFHSLSSRQPSDPPWQFVSVPGPSRTFTTCGLLRRCCQPRRTLDKTNNKALALVAIGTAASFLTARYRPRACTFRRQDKRIADPPPSLSAEASAWRFHFRHLSYPPSCTPVASWICLKYPLALFTFTLSSNYNNQKQQTYFHLLPL